VTIVDQDGEELESGQAGEVVVAGADIALAYWRDPELTERTFETLLDGRRRMRTGDRGRLLPNGVLELLGRIDDGEISRGVLPVPSSDALAGGHRAPPTTRAARPPQHLGPRSFWRLAARELYRWRKPS